jgi:hypothetical protein
MHSAIVCLNMPYGFGSQKWRDFMADVDRLRYASPDHLEKQKGVSRLAENVWLVNFVENPAALSRLVSAAVEHQVAYGILQFDAEPRWLPAGYSPKTN